MLVSLKNEKATMLVFQTSPFSYVKTSFCPNKFSLLRPLEWKVITSPPTSSPFEILLDKVTKKRRYLSNRVALHFL